MNSQTLQIKERVSIVEVVSSYIKLEKAGTNYKARCPFHNEKSASFFVSPTRNSFHCFGCAKSGDIFTFVQEIEGIEFKDALVMLADRAGIVLSKGDLGQKTKEEQMYLALEEAARFFEDELARNTSILLYLEKRGLSKETIKDFRIGYAKDGWRNLVEHMKSRGFSDTLVLDVGLSIPHAKGNYDRFRGRIMFPIANSSGKIVAFTGRIFPEKEDSVGGKYMNSPETPLFNKSKILFGYDKAKQSMMKEDVAILVEGQMDLIMAHQAGTKNAVAVSGTALTEDQLKMIKRFTDKLLVVFDGDSAGFKAASRGYKLALALGMDVSFAELPDGADPADLILKDVEAWRESIKNDKNIINFYIDSLKKKGLAERELMKQIRENVLPYINEIRSSMDQAYFIKEISTLIQVPEMSIREDLKNIKRENINNLDKNIPSIQSPPDQLEARSMLEQIEDRLFAFILVARDINASIELVERLSKEYKRITEVDIDDKIKNLSDNEKDRLIFEGENHFSKIQKFEDEINRLIISLEKEILNKKIEKLSVELKDPKLEKDTEKMKSILLEYGNLSKRIDTLISQYNNN
jgi:DNA primase